MTSFQRGPKCLKMSVPLRQLLYRGNMRLRDASSMRTATA